MDYELLVDVQVDDGHALIAELVQAGFDVAIAFWVKLSEEGSWFLYIGSTSLVSMSAGKAFSAIYAALNRSHPASMTYTEVRLVDPSNPIAANAIEIRDRFPARLPTRLRAKKLGDLAIEEAYIYPRHAGSLSRDQVVQTVALLMNRTGALAPSLITLRDGSLIQGVPTTLRMDAPGGVQIVLHDLVNDTDRTISADEVISIH